MSTEAASEASGEERSRLGRCVAVRGAVWCGVLLVDRKGEVRWRSSERGTI